MLCNCVLYFKTYAICLINNYAILDYVNRHQFAGMIKGICVVNRPYHSVIVFTEL